MHRSIGLVSVALGVTVLAASIGACSSSDGDDEGSGSTTPSSAGTGKPATVEQRAPEEIGPPPAEGNGITMPQPAAPAPDGWVVEELLVAGTARSFEAGETPADGRWTASVADEAAYRTRVVVRRPASAEDFSGTVIVEWFNVSALEASPDWAFLAGEIGREGHAYIGVSTQAQGVEGGATLLDVEVDAGEAEAAGVEADTSGLVNIDPDRYGTLEHPGDAFAYDLFAQVGRAATTAPDQLLGGLEPTQVIGVGESQSAAFLSTYVNAIHPLDPVFDAFLIHSRGGGVAPVDGDLMAVRGDENADAWRSDGVAIRTDLDEPVFIFETETDLTLLGYANARQDDTDTVRTWEVAGLSHADAHFVRSITGGPRDPGIGDLLGCEAPINIGPQHEVLQAALHHLVAWTAGGDPPPTGTRIELTDDEETTIARDDLGIALGGVRHPMVDVPAVTISGDPPAGITFDDVTAGTAGLCALFGTTAPIERQTLVDRYQSVDGYVAAFTASADEAVAAGTLLRPDADALVAEVDANPEPFGP